MKVQAILVGLLLASGGASGCAAGPAAEGDDSEAASAAATARALPISGDWALVGWKGHVSTHVGSVYADHPVDRTFDARERTGLVTFDLDADGNGTLRGSAHCMPRLQEVGGTPSGPRAATTVTGTFAIVSALWNLIETARCDPTRDVFQTTRVWQRRGLFGGPDTRLAANLGVYGETKSLTAADNECRALRGTRWITFGEGALACVGYADAEARTLKMLVQRPTEIHVQRLLMRRPGAPRAEVDVAPLQRL